MARNIIIAHTDVDGVCSAAIAARFLNFNYRLFFSGPRGFDQTLRRISGHNCDTMVVVDIALNDGILEEIMKEIRRIKGEGCSRIIWIDHHSWSGRGAEEVSREVELRLESSPSAASLAQRVLMPQDEVSRRIAELGDDADTNTNALKDTLAFKVAIMDPGARKALVYELSRGNFEPPGIDEWRARAREELRVVDELARGARIITTRGGRRFGFVDMRGVKAIGSLVAKNIIGQGASFVFILYTDTSGVLYGDGSVDMLRIAREFGGGGHMSASGVSFRQGLLDRIALRVLGRRYLPSGARELIKRLTSEF